MAGGELDQDNITLNLGEGGPNVGTDFISQFGQGAGLTGAHLQVVKLSYGAFGSSTLTSTANPFPVRIQGINPNSTTIPVGGDTQGGAVLVTGTFDIGEVNVTFGASTVDIRSVDAGVTFGVVNASGTTLDITGSAVSISSVVLPSSTTMGTKQIAAGGDVSLAGFTCSTGIKIKNFAGFTQTGGAMLGVKDQASTATGTADYFLMQIGEEIFIEVDNIDNLKFNAFEESGVSNAVVTYQAS